MSRCRWSRVRNSPPACGKKLHQFDLGENTVTKGCYAYPYTFSASRGADQSSGGPSKTLVLHITE